MAVSFYPSCFLRSIFFITTPANNADVIPVITPPKISVGKCTNRYILEKAMIIAKANIAIPYFLLYAKIDAAVAMQAEVGPDGKENSVGLAISN